MKENYRLILTGQHLLILTYNLIFEEITTKNFPIHVKIYTGLPINQVIWDSNNAGMRRKEIFKNIRSKVGDDYPLLFRFGHDEKVNGGRTLEESVMVGRYEPAIAESALLNGCAS